MTRTHWQSPFFCISYDRVPLRARTASDQRRDVIFPTYPSFGYRYVIKQLFLGDDHMPATITGTVFNDLNHNGQFDPGEPGIPNVFVTLRNTTANTCVQTQRLVLMAATVFPSVQQGPTVSTKPSCRRRIVRPQRFRSLMASSIPMALGCCL